MNSNYKNPVYVIRSASRHFLSSTNPNRWGTIEDSRVFTNFYEAREVASRFKDATVRHILVK